MKKFLFLVVLLILLSGCSPKLQTNEEVVQKNKEKKGETGIMTKNQISTNYYKTLLPYKASKSRGLVVSNINSRYDIGELETGLMRISQNEYSPDSYLFQEGQYLDKDTITSLLSRKSEKNKDGLNPESTGEGKERAPIYLAHILEQDYLKKTDKDTVALGGIAIGLAMNSVDYYQKEKDGDTYEQTISDADLLAKGKEMAQTLLERLRETKGLENVPIVMAIYKQGERNAVAPGNYLAYTVAEGKSIGDWKETKEKNYVLPSTEMTKAHKAESNAFSNFKNDIEKYYPNYTGVVGRVRYEGSQMAEMEIDIPLQFYGKAEIIGFTQYITDLVNKHLAFDTNLQVNITTTEGPAALITREKDSNDTKAHIYN